SARTEKGGQVSAIDRSRTGFEKGRHQLPGHTRVLQRRSPALFATHDGSGGATVSGNGVTAVARCAIVGRVVWRGASHQRSQQNLMVRLADGQPSGPGGCRTAL